MWTSLLRGAAVASRVLPRPRHVHDTALIAEVVRTARSWQEVDALWRDCSMDQTRSQRVAMTEQSAPAVASASDVFADTLRRVLTRASAVDTCLNAYFRLSWPLCVTAGEMAVEMAARDAARTGDIARLANVLGRVYSCLHANTPRIGAARLGELLAVVLSGSRTASGDVILSLHHSFIVGTDPRARLAAARYREFCDGVDAMVGRELARLSVGALCSFLIVQNPEQSTAVWRRAVDEAYERRAELTVEHLVQIARQLARVDRPGLARFLRHLDGAAADRLLLITDRKLQQLCQVFFAGAYVAERCPFIEILCSVAERRATLGREGLLSMLHYAVMFLDVPVEIVAQIVNSLLCGDDESSQVALLNAELLQFAHIFGHRTVRDAYLGSSPVADNDDERGAIARRLLLRASDTLLDDIVRRDVATFAIPATAQIITGLRLYACRKSHAAQQRFLVLLDHATTAAVLELQASGRASLSGASQERDEVQQSTLPSPKLLAECFASLADLAARRRDPLVFSVLRCLLALAQTIFPGEGEVSLGVLANVCMALKRLKARPERWLAAVVAALVELHATGRLLLAENVSCVAKCVHCLAMLDVPLPLNLQVSAARGLASAGAAFMEENLTAVERLLWCLVFPGGRAKPAAALPLLQEVFAKLPRAEGPESTLRLDVKQRLYGGLGVAAAGGGARPTAATPMSAQLQACLAELLGPALIVPYHTDFGFAVDATFCLDAAGRPVPWVPLAATTGVTVPSAPKSASESLCVASALRSLGGTATTSPVVQPGGAMTSWAGNDGGGGDDIAVRVAVVSVSAGMRLFMSDRFFGVLRARVALLEAHGWHCLCLRNGRDLEHVRTAAYVDASVRRLFAHRHAWSGYHDYLRFMEELFRTR